MSDVMQRLRAEQKEAQIRDLKNGNHESLKEIQKGANKKSLETIRTVLETILDLRGRE